jgi:hypothetical protein
MTLANIEKIAKGYLVFLKAHEKLLIILLAAGMLYHVYGAGLQAWVNHDQRQSDIAAQKVKADADSNKAFQDQLNQLAIDTKKQLDDIKSSMQQRDADTQKQKKADDAMSPVEIAIRLQKLLAVGPQEVTWSPITGDVQFTPNAAHIDADALEDLSQLKADKAQLTTALTNEQTLNATQAEFITKKTQELADEKTSHQKDVDTLKAENHKQYMRGFKHGTIFGIISGEVLRLLFTKKL